MQNRIFRKQKLHPDSAIHNCYISYLKVFIFILILESIMLERMY